MKGNSGSGVPFFLRVVVSSAGHAAARTASAGATLANAPPPQEVVVTLSRGREIYCHIQSANNEIILRSESVGSTRLRCIVSNACGSVTSNPATLTICVADTDDGSGTGTCDGGVTIEDLIYYLGIFDAGLPAADVDDGSFTGTRDGGVTIEDLLYYLFIFDLGLIAADVDDGTGTGTTDGGVTIDDLLYYLQRFDAGC